MQKLETLLKLVSTSIVSWRAAFAGKAHHMDNVEDVATRQCTTMYVARTTSYADNSLGITEELREAFIALRDK